MVEVHIKQSRIGKLGLGFALCALGMGTLVGCGDVEEPLAPEPFPIRGVENGAPTPDTGDVSQGDPSAEPTSTPTPSPSEPEPAEERDPVGEPNPDQGGNRGQGGMPGEPEETNPVEDQLCGTFEEDIQGILDASCTSCHGSSLQLGGLDLSASVAYQNLLTGASDSGLPYVVPGDLASSYLVAKLGPNPPEGSIMPPPPSVLSPEATDQLEAWVLAGAPNGDYGGCAEPPASPETVQDVTFEVDCAEPVPGNLVIAFFTDYPPTQAPVVAGQVENVSFPLGVVVPGVPAGSYTVQVMLDASPFNPQAQGPEDLVALVDVEVPTNAAVSVSLSGPQAPANDPPEEGPGAPEETPEGPVGPVQPESACGICAPGLECGIDPEIPETICSGDTGSCGDLTYGGTCLDGGVLLFCSEDSPAGKPVSLDCSMNEELASCGQTSPDFYDCVEAVIDPFDVPGQVTYADIHPIMVASCSGWVCHQYNGFAQADIAAAYEVVLEKDFADDILGAILSGSMPAGNFGFPLCSGDPSQDTNPKCLTQEQQDLVKAWVEYETGVPLVPEMPLPGEIVTFNQVQPILNKGCSGLFCHSGGLASDDLEEAYGAVVSKNLCEPILEQIQAGAMPPNKGCTGDPVQDANIPGCLGVVEHQIILQWVSGGPEPCPGPE